jgi:hypothetical protein
VLHGHRTLEMRQSSRVSQQFQRDHSPRLRVLRSVDLAATPCGEEVAESIAGDESSARGVLRAHAVAREPTRAKGF